MNNNNTTNTNNNYDLTLRISPYLDRHMVFPLLEFLDSSSSSSSTSANNNSNNNNGGCSSSTYSSHDVKMARLALLRPTNMVDYAIDVYRSIHENENENDDEKNIIIPQEMLQQRDAVLSKLESLTAGCQSLITLLNDKEHKLLLWNCMATTTTASAANNNENSHNKDEQDNVVNNQSSNNITADHDTDTRSSRSRSSRSIRLGNGTMIPYEVIETYRLLARYKFDCGDYQASRDMLVHYLCLFSKPPPETLMVNDANNANDEDDEQELIEAMGIQQQQQQVDDGSSNKDDTTTTIGNPTMYYLTTMNMDLLQVLWGRLACEILLLNWEAASIAIDAVKTAMEILVSQRSMSALQALQQRTWLLHWSLFVYWNDSSTTTSTSSTGDAAGGNEDSSSQNKDKNQDTQGKDHNNKENATSTTTTGGGLEQLVELFHTERYKQAITTNAPHLLRYLTAAVLICKRRVATASKKNHKDGSSTTTTTTLTAAETRRLLRNLVTVIQDCYSEYTDPIVDFVNCLCIKYDFTLAQEKLHECEYVLRNDFFLYHQSTLFMEEARIFVFENYCRIHNKIDLNLLGQQLAMKQYDEIERWMVDLILHAGLDAKINNEQQCVVMMTNNHPNHNTTNSSYTNNSNTNSVYEQVLDRTRDLNVRSATLTQNLQHLLHEMKKNNYAIQQQQKRNHH